MAIRIVSDCRHERPPQSGFSKTVETSLELSANGQRYQEAARGDSLQANDPAATAKCYARSQRVPWPANQAPRSKTASGASRRCHSPGTASRQAANHAREQPAEENREQRQLVPKTIDGEARIPHLLPRRDGQWR